MENKKLISFDLKADFAFFKKPDYNVGLQLSYNILHKPALLGILGAIAGLKGYQKKNELPEYYETLKHLRLSIEPLEHERGNYQKTTVKYTNGVGYANADGNLLIEETMLISPSYRCYVALDISQEVELKLYNNIMNQSAEFIPYLGKNEFQAWMDKPQEWSFQNFKAKSSFVVDSLLIKAGVLHKQVVETELSFDMEEMGSFTYFEKLPITLDEELMQYSMCDFAFTDWKMKQGSKVSNLYALENNKETKIIQLF